MKIITLNSFTRSYRRDFTCDSQREFAGRVGCCYMWLSKLENCRIAPDDPTLPQFISALAIVTGAPESWLQCLPVEKQEPQGEPAFICRVQDIEP